MKAIIIGTGGHAKVVLNALHCIGPKDDNLVIGFLDDFAPKGQAWPFCSPVLGTIDEAEKYKDSVFFIAIGDNSGRKQVAYRLRGMNLAWSIIHPSSTTGLWSTFGQGSFVAAGANVGFECKVGEFSIINTHANLDHNSSVGNFSHLAPGVVTGGHVTIGDNTFIGLGSMIRDRVKIGNNCTVGMGSVVLKDIPDNSIAYGNPCVLQTTT